MNSVISLLFFIFSHITTKLLGIASRIPHVCDYTCSEKNHESERMRVIFMLTAVGKVSEFNGATKKGSIENTSCICTIFYLTSCQVFSMIV